MDTSAAYEVASAVLYSVGGAAVIIVGLSSWLGKIWAERILGKEKQEYATELESLRSQLHLAAEKQQLVFSLYFEGQFKVYNDLWLSISELQNEVEKLWEHASARNLHSFIKALSNAKRKIRNSALLIDQVHYQEIMETINNLEDYRIGKERLIAARNEGALQNIDEIAMLVQHNQQNKDVIDDFTDHMLQVMRQKLSRNE